MNPFLSTKKNLPISQSKTAACGYESEKRASMKQTFTDPVVDGK
jgi:hypothetical protein